MNPPTTERQLRLDGRTLKDAMTESAEFVSEATVDHRPRKTFLLVSGGGDSMVLLDLFKGWADAVVHVNTGIGIPQTNEFVREQVRKIGVPLIELHPPVPYDELVLNPKYFGGFPGPDAHRFFYQRLKERCIRQLLRDHRTENGQRFLLLTGVRRAESRRRMGYANPVNRAGGQVWVNPLLFWDNGDMDDYREKNNVPLSEPSQHLHMSGECLCGAYAHPGELDEIDFFYPSVADRIRDLEKRAESAGLRSCKWGQGGPAGARGDTGPMCTSCDFRQGEMFA